MRLERCRQREEEMDKMSGSSTPMILPAVLISLWMAACSARSEERRVGKEC